MHFMVKSAIEIKESVNRHIGGMEVVCCRKRF